MGRTRYKQITHFGREMTIAQLSRETGLSSGCLQQRYSKGQRDAELVKPVQARATHGKQAPMNLAPRDRSHDALVSRWNELVTGGVG